MSIAPLLPNWCPASSMRVGRCEQEGGMTDNKVPTPLSIGAPACMPPLLKHDKGDPEEKDVDPCPGSVSYAAHDRRASGGCISATTVTYDGASP